MDDRILRPVTGDRPVSTVRGSDLAATDGAEVAVRSGAAKKSNTSTIAQDRTGSKHGHFKGDTEGALGLSNTLRTRILRE